MFASQGFQDTGIRTTYLNDLWAWSLTESVLLRRNYSCLDAFVDSPIHSPSFRWHKVEFSDLDRKPP